MNEGAFANYYAREEVENESWYLVGYLDAKNVSAYGGVGILVRDRYTESQETLFGTVNLAIMVENYTWYHNQFVYGWCCNNRGFRDTLQRVAYCRGHWVPSEASSNITGIDGFEPFYDFDDIIDGDPVPRHTTIALKVKVCEGTYKWLTGKSLTTTDKVRIKVKGSYEVVESETEFTHETKGIK